MQLKNGGRALVAGSFDPVTKGHENIVNYALTRYETVYVTAFINSEKEYHFDAEERLQMLKSSFSGNKNIIVDMSNGYLADYCKEKGINTVVKGVRNEKDAEYEKIQQEFNSKRNPSLKTEYYIANANDCDISSTLVRKKLAAKEDIKGLVPSGAYLWLSEHGYIEEENK
ncbi:MAG: pantetheine-phosphate adenylyltransferase [Clostridia bacterium]|nr:pantetheine-phosphate adenylyltransferase [Clostridia bacterium]